jgi:hypothetical protein
MFITFLWNESGLKIMSSKTIGKKEIANIECQNIATTFPMTMMDNTN